MADVSITAAEVLHTSNTTFEVGNAGETITAGTPVYKKTSDGGAFWKCDADTAAEALVAGIALASASDGQKLPIATSGDIDPGFTAIVGETYVVSATAGAIAPIGDLVSTDFTSILGIATSATNLKLDGFVGGTAKA